jgi:adenylate kinase family enzyme
MKQVLTQGRKVSMHQRMRGELSKVKDKVLHHNWDYVAVVAGLPGSGKSTFARGCAKYLCEWFDSSYVAFTAEEFIKITNNAPEFSAIVLDEAFQALNTRVTMSPDFLRIVNHLQLIRQKHLFIFLCLPNFFDLSKGIAVFRTSHLFVTYASKEGQRGRVLAFGRDTKRKLYVKGSRYMDYNCVRSNFHCSYYKNRDILDEPNYLSKKKQHLLDQDKKIDKKKKPKMFRDVWIKEAKRRTLLTDEQIGLIFNLSRRRVSEILQTG